MTDAEKLETLLKPVKNNFRRILKQDLPNFMMFKQSISEGELITDASYNEIKAKCHKIKGSSKTLGFADLGNSAAEVENCIAALLTAKSETGTTSDLNTVFDTFLTNVRTATLMTSIDQ